MENCCTLLANVFRRFGYDTWISLCDRVRWYIDWNGFRSHQIAVSYTHLILRAETAALSLLACISFFYEMAGDHHENTGTTGK